MDRHTSPSPVRAARLALLLVGLALLVPGAAGQQAEPSRREVEALVEEALAMPWWSWADLEARDAVLARLEAVPPLSSRDADRWRKALLKDAQGLDRKLPKKNGRHWFWEDEERGLFIVGGKLKKPKGLLIGMHGGGVGSGDAGTSHSAINNAAEKMGWVAIFPEVLQKTEHGWTDSGTEEWVVELIDRARRTWKIDPDHVYLSGHSMGGYGSWTLGAHHADMVAAVAPSAGAPTPYYDKDGKIWDIAAGVIPSLRNVSMVIYQSIDDPRVPPDANQAAVKRLGEADERWGGYDYEYWEVDGRGHDLPPGGFKALLTKIKKAEREPLPERVVWQPALEWKRQFYWLWWRDPVREAIVQADLDRDANTLHVRCDKDPKGLHVLLNDALVDMDREVVVLFGDEGREVWRGVPERHLATLVRTAARNDEGLVFDVMIPVDGSATGGG